MSEKRVDIKMQASLIIMYLPIGYAEDVASLKFSIFELKVF